MDSNIAFLMAVCVAVGCVIGVAFRRTKGRAPSSKPLSPVAHELIEESQLVQVKARVKAVVAAVTIEQTHRLQAPLFMVGDAVRVVCSAENFHGGWECLSSGKGAFTPGCDEEATVSDVIVDASHLEDLFEDYRSHGFSAWWERTFGRGLSHADSEELIVCAARRFLETHPSNPLYYSYRLSFKNEKVEVTYGIAERLLAPAVLAQGE
jgi:hypothetical protein